MEKWNNNLLGLERIKGVDMVDYLETLGYKPTAIRKKGTDYWYRSPLRDEYEASFHVSRVRNEWYDFPLAAGGNLVDFCLRYHQCSIRELLEKFDSDFRAEPLREFNASLYEGRLGGEGKLLVTSTRPIYAYPLKAYLHERSIPVAIAECFCVEVAYQVNGNSYYGIGFKNNAGGYEIRNKNFKQSSSPKDITTLRFGAGEVHVFEGFFDFLSYRTLHPYAEPGKADFVVLNGAGMFGRALPLLEAYERVGLWLDRDVTGRAYTEYALSLGGQFKDNSGLYSKHKDLNDWLIHKGELQSVRVKPQNRLMAGT
jgi:hypothetical protein